MKKNIALLLIACVAVITTVCPMELMEKPDPDVWYVVKNENVFIAGWKQRGERIKFGQLCNGCQIKNMCEYKEDMADARPSCKAIGVLQSGIVIAVFRDGTILQWDSAASQHVKRSKLRLPSGKEAKNFGGVFVEPCGLVCFNGLPLEGDEESTPLYGYNLVTNGCVLIKSDQEITCEELKVRYEMCTDLELFLKTNETGLETES